MQRYNKIILALAAFGVLLSVYLLAQQYYRPAFRPCTVNSTINCDAIIDGPVAKTFGLPTPLYGLIGYVAIAYFSLKKQSKAIVGFATGGLVFCLSIAYVELAQLHVVCPVCILCQLTMIGIFTLSIFQIKKGVTE
jgi:uncharacterized membrane protein